LDRTAWGFMNPRVGLNATFAACLANPGSVAFVSHREACVRPFWTGHEEKVGFSAFVSLGSMIDIGWGDIIDYLVKTRIPRRF